MSGPPQFSTVINQSINQALHVRYQVGIVHASYVITPYNNARQPAIHPSITDRS
jgi:hypothetical protein